MAEVITYECKQCGCEITVSEGRGSSLMPIYCCGVEVSKVSFSPNKAAAKKKPASAAVRKTLKKVAAKKSTAGAANKKKNPVWRKTSKK